ncbi:YraN family protein [Thalassospira sp. MA62]|nr:YraN family protein [Thalassospira sp. MA62]
MPRSAPPPSDTTRRKRAERAGRRAETICGIWLRLKGYQILATRHKSPLGEIDIIARRGNILIAVEVKNRSDRATALYAVTPKQQNRIARSLGAYAVHIGHTGDLRLDLMIIRHWGRIEHLRNAWQVS